MSRRVTTPSISGIMMQTYARIIPIVTGLGILCMLTGSVSAAVFQVSGGDSCIPAGSQTDISIRLSDIPQGLSGLNISVAVSDPKTASITNITFPEWAVLHTKIPLSSDTVGLKMVDLVQKINTGAADVTVCRLTISAHKSGTTVLTITPVVVEDDAGGQYTIPPVTKTVCSVSSVQADESPVTRVTDTPGPAESPSLSGTPAPAPAMDASAVSATADPLPSGSRSSLSLPVPDTRTGGSTENMESAPPVPAKSVPQPSGTTAVPSPSPGLIPCLAVVALAGLIFGKKEER